MMIQLSCVAAILLALIPFASLSARTYYVRTSGNDSKSGDSPGNAFRTIKKLATKVVEGDTAYVGGGTYQDANATSFSATGKKDNPIRLIADTTGAKTSDAGPVIILTPPNGNSVYAWNFPVSHHFYITGFTFRRNPAAAASELYHRGLYLAPANSSNNTEEGTFAFTDCRFENLYYDIVATEVADLVFTNCTSTGNSYISLYLSNSDTILTNCSFSNGQYMSVYSLGSNSDCQLDACTFTNTANYGIYGSNTASMKVKNSTFSNVRYSVLAYADTASVDNCTLTLTDAFSRANWGNYAVWVGSPKQGAVTFSSCTISGFNVGTYIMSNDVAMTNVNITGMGTNYYNADGSANSNWKESYGIIVHGYPNADGSWNYARRFSYNNTSGTLTGCYMGIYTYSSDVAISRATISGHVHGVYSSGGYSPGSAITITNSTIKDCLWNGVSLNQAASLTATNSRFLNNGVNTVNGGWAFGWGLYFSGYKPPSANYWDGVPGNALLNMQNCKFTGNGNSFSAATCRKDNVILAGNAVDGGLVMAGTTPTSHFGWGVSLGNGDYALLGSEFTITKCYYGLGSQFGNFSVKNYTLRDNYHGVFLQNNTTAEVANCTITANPGTGIYTSSATAVNINNCTLNGNGSGQQDYSSTTISLKNSTAHNNAAYGFYVYGSWPSVTTSPAVTISNIKANSNGQQGLYIWEPSSVVADQLTCNGNQYWGASIYANYAKYIWDNFPTNRPSFTSGTRPTYTPTIKFTNVTCSQNVYSGGLYFYSYEHTGTSETPWLRNDNQFVELKNITADDNMWYGVYLGYCTCLGPTTSNLALESKNNYYGLVFNGQSIVLDGMMGMNLHDNAYGLNVWYGNATLTNVNMGINTWNINLQGYYDPGTNNQNPSPGFGKFTVQNCTFDGGGLQIDYPASLSIKDTTVKNGRRSVAYGRANYGTWQPEGGGISTWRSNIPMTMCEYKNLSVTNSYQGIVNDGYHNCNAVLDNVTCDNNDYHGGAIYHTSYTLSNSKFRNNGKKLRTDGVHYVGYYGFVDSPNTYDFSTSQWTNITTIPTNVTNCDFTGNARYGYVHYYSPLTMTNCTANDNGYGIYNYEAHGSFINCTANNNYNRDYSNSGLGGIVSRAYLAPYNHVARDCTSSGNYGYGIEFYNPNRSLVGTPTATIESCTANGNANCGITSYWCKTDVENSEASGNLSHGFMNVYNDVTMTGCQANNNGQPNAWSTSASGAMGIHNQGGYYYEDTPATPNYFAHAGLILDDLAYSDTHYNVVKNQYNKQVISNCTTDGNYYIGAMNIYGEGQFTNCQANNNTLYGFHFGHGREDGVLSSVVQNCTANGNGSIAYYQYDATTNITNCTSAGSGYGFYLIGTWYRYESKPITVKNCTVSNGNGHGVYSYYANIDLSDVAVSGFQGWNMQSNYSKANVNSCSFNGGRGGVLTAYDSSDTFRDCEMSGNTSDWALISQFTDTFIAERCKILNNGSWGLGSYLTKSAVIKNNVISGNVNGTWIGDTGTGAEVWNNTIANSKSQYGIYAYSGYVNAHNNIIANNGAYGLGSYQATLTHSHNLVSGHMPGTDFWKSGLSAAQAAALRTADEPNKPPRFVDPTVNDYRLAKGSPAINSGLNAPGIVDTDLLGNARPMFAVTEIGAYEYLDKSGSVRPLTWSERK